MSSLDDILRPVHPPGRPDLVSWRVAAEMLGVPGKEMLWAAVRGESGVQYVDQDFYFPVAEIRARADTS